MGGWGPVGWGVRMDEGPRLTDGDSGAEYAGTAQEGIETRAEAGDDARDLATRFRDAVLDRDAEAGCSVQ